MVKWELGFPFLDWENGIYCTAWDWDLITGYGKGNFKNGNEIYFL